jgi:hypothetical protein
MARRATGAVVRSKSDAYALRFTAYGERRYVTLGTGAEGWTRDRAEAEFAERPGGRAAGALDATLPDRGARARPDRRPDLP